MSEMRKREDIEASIAYKKYPDQQETLLKLILEVLLDIRDRKPKKTQEN